MRKKYSFFFVLVVSVSLLSCKSPSAKGEQGKKGTAQNKPNIILIMADDMGFSDLGSFGGEIHTPNLDRLGENGLKFTQFYNTARCCPTRASVLTGLYPQQTGIGHMTNPSENFSAHDLGISSYRGFLNNQNLTIAEMLKGAGYATFMTGKWHLGMEERNQWPLQRGFDKFYGILDGATNFFKPEYPRGITLNNSQVTITEENYYTTDAFTDYAIQFIDEGKQKEEEKPFFLYLAYNAPHWPLQAPQADIERYKGKYLNGWHYLRRERFERMQNLGIIDPNWKLSPEDGTEWENLSKEKQEEMDLRMAIYAAQVDRMDQNIGKLINYLEQKDLIGNTIILFLMDNGACAEGGDLGWGPKEKLETKEGYLLSYGQSWANASNTPFRKYKHWLHEGGISTPLILHWPEGINEKDQGKIVESYGFMPDIMATIKELGKADYPEKVNGNDIPKLVGSSLLPLLKGDDQQIHIEPIFWEHEGNKAVRLGKYKLVMEWKGEGRNKWELYNMDKDRTETNDLASEMPDRVEEMAGMWENWAEEMKVEPWENIQKLMKDKRDARKE